MLESDHWMFMDGWYDFHNHRLSRLNSRASSMDLKLMTAATWPGRCFPPARPSRPSKPSPAMEHFPDAHPCMEC